MVKKILSSIVLIMIICSSCIYATNEIIPGDETNSSEGQETVVPDDSVTNSDSENKSPETEDKDNNSSSKEDVNQETDSNESKENNSSTGENNTNKNNQTNSNIETPKDTIQLPTQNNNQQTTINNNITQKSSENRLKELKVDVEGLTPEFDKNTDEYYLIVDLNVDKIKITASTVDNKAKWAVYGNKNLKEGENTVTIVVTAEDGTKKEYYIYVTKVDNIELANAELEKLDIEGFNLYPTFKSNIYSYNLNINKDISSLNIMALPVNENATVEIEKNDNLQKGENIIKIKVTAANGETFKTYKINTYIYSEEVIIKEENKMPAVILIAVLGACIIGLGISIAVKNRR